MNDETYRARIERELRQEFSPVALEITDDSHRHAGHAGQNTLGESHFSIRIVSPVFAGMSAVTRRREVYRVLADELHERVRATLLYSKTIFQHWVRKIVIPRDKGCILRRHRHCGGEAGYSFLEGGIIGKVLGLVFQTDHLITRVNSATYADTRPIVCLCQPCHGWKHCHKEEYDALVKTILPPDRLKPWEECERASWKPVRTTLYDWKLAALKQEHSQLIETVSCTSVN
jgi:BolA family transcriptional regulator, general stress-responsive regulator